MLPRNKALWLVKNSHVTWNSQSEFFISALWSKKKKSLIILSPQEILRQNKPEYIYWPEAVIKTAGMRTRVSSEDFSLICHRCDRHHIEYFLISVRFDKANQAEQLCQNLNGQFPKFNNVTHFEHVYDSLQDQLVSVCQNVWLPVSASKLGATTDDQNAIEISNRSPLTTGAYENRVYDVQSRQLERAENKTDVR